VLPASNEQVDSVPVGYICPLANRAYTWRNGQSTRVATTCHCYVKGASGPKCTRATFLRRAAISAGQDTLPFHAINPEHLTSRKDVSLAHTHRVAKNGLV